MDWSGTLVDDLPAVWRATNHVFGQAGLDEMTLEQFRAEFCLPFKKFYDRFTPEVPLSQLETWFHGHYREVQDSVVSLPHALNFLNFCKEHGRRLFVLSSVHPEHFATQVAVSGFGAFFEKCYVGVWDKRAMIHQILAENNLRGDETLFVGDMEHDIETARHGGVFSCGVLTGYNGLEQLRNAQPTLIVEHLGELQRLLGENRFEVPGRTGVPERNVEPPVVTVGALIFNRTGQVLMIRTHKWSDLWGIPGGKIKPNEPALDALRREVEEETNLLIDQIHFVLVQDCIQSPEFYRPAHFVLLNYTCQAQEGREVRLNEEATTYRWLSLEEAWELPLNQPTRRLIQAVRPLLAPSL